MIFFAQFQSANTGTLSQYALVVSKVLFGALAAAHTSRPKSFEDQPER